MTLRAQQIRWLDKRMLKESWTKAWLAPCGPVTQRNTSRAVLGKYAQVASSRSASMSCKTSLGRVLVCPSWEKIWSNASFISLGLPLVWMESNRGKKWYELRKYKGRKDYQVAVTENNPTSRGLFTFMDRPYGLASRMWKCVKDTYFEWAMAQIMCSSNRSIATPFT